MALSFFEIYDEHTDFPQIFNRYKVVHCNLYASDDSIENFYYQLGVRIGRPLVFVQDKNSGNLVLNQWTEVKYDGGNAGDDFITNNKAQNLHTDYGHFSFETYGAFEFCLESAPKGGEINFADADKIANLLKEKNSSLFQNVQNVKIQFGDKRNALTNTSDYILQQDDLGWKINWNYEQLVNDTNNKSLVEDFREFMDNQIEHSSLIKTIQLNPGEGVYWHDRRVLHGRNAFEGNRHHRIGGVVKKIPNDLWKLMEKQDLKLIDGVKLPTGHLADAKRLLEQVKEHKFDKRLF